MSEDTKKKVAIYEQAHATYVCSVCSKSHTAKSNYDAHRIKLVEHLFEVGWKVKLGRLFCEKCEP